MKPKGILKHIWGESEDDEGVTNASPSGDVKEYLPNLFKGHKRSHLLRGLRSKEGRSYDIKGARWDMNTGPDAPQEMQQCVVKFGLFKGSNCSNFSGSLKQQIYYLAKEQEKLNPHVPVVFQSSAGDLSKSEALSFAEKISEDRHHFRVILSPEYGDKLDLKTYTEEFISLMEKDLGTSLEWTAVSHYGTDDAHAHILLRGKRENGEDLVIPKAYISRGARYRARQLATKYLGPRTSNEIRQSLINQLENERLTLIDHWIIKRSTDGVYRHTNFSLHTSTLSAREKERNRLIYQRLQFLANKGYISKLKPRSHTYSIPEDLAEQLKNKGQEHDIYLTMQREMGEYDSSERYQYDRRKDDYFDTYGKVITRGVLNEQTGVPYITVSGFDGRAYHIPISKGVEYEGKPANPGDIVKIISYRREIHRASDQIIADVFALAVNRSDNTFVYEPSVLKRAIATWGRGKDSPYANPDVRRDAFLNFERRLAALEKLGIATRNEDNQLVVPANIHDALEQYYADKNLNRLSIENFSNKPLDALVEQSGLTVLDKFLAQSGFRDKSIPPPKNLAEVEFRKAVEARISWLSAHKKIRLQYDSRDGLIVKIIHPKDLFRLHSDGVANLASILKSRHKKECKILSATDRIEGTYLGPRHTDSGPVGVIEGSKMIGIFPLSNYHSRLQHGDYLRTIPSSPARLRQLRDEHLHVVLVNYDPESQSISITR